MAQSLQESEEWNRIIDEAINTPDPIIANYKITRVHYLLSEALIDAVGAVAGSNFHSWAVWGSRKAGVTIRQEDKDQASRDASVVAGNVGGVVGLGVGWLMATLLSWPLPAAIAAWVVIGIATGAYCGYLLACYTRSAAARLIFAGNCIVLDDIGRVTGRYLEYVETQRAGGGNPQRTAFSAFVAPFHPGPTEQGGQDLIRRAFEQYEIARLSNDAKVKQECNYFANCLAVLHEHIRLQPYISRSLPFLISKCVTQRLMSYSVGEQLLAVHEDVPPLDVAEFPPALAQIERAELREFLEGPAGWDPGRGTLRNTRAMDWTNLRERMGYIVNLFRTRHQDLNVVAAPFSTRQLELIELGRVPVERDI